MVYSKKKRNFRPLLDCLRQLLNSGTWHGRKWQCTDINIQRQVVHLILSLLEFATKDKQPNRHIQDSISAAVNALVSILEYKNVAVLRLAAYTAKKLVSNLNDAILQSFVLDLVSPLSSLLSYHQKEVSKLCAEALDLMLSNPTLLKNEKGVWDILKRTETIRHAISNMRSFSGGTTQIELFQSMASLLSAVLCRWPLSRFPVYSDDPLMTMLSGVLVKPDSCGNVGVLKFLSSIALCGSGAARLLENGESLLRMILQCMDSSQPHSVRIEGFRLARRLAINEERFSKMSSLCCEPLVRAIISGMSVRGMNFEEYSDEQLSLIRKACRLALITRWQGEHHILFWKHEIGIVLVDLLKPEFPHNPMWCDDQRLASIFYTCNLLALRKYAWDVLGWLATHCKEGFDPEEHGNQSCIDMVITSACSNFVGATQKVNVSSGHTFNNIDMKELEFLTRACFMMIYSPCKYIASKARSVLSELLAPHGMDILEAILQALMSNLEDSPSLNSFLRQVEINNVMALACFMGLLEFRSCVLDFSGLKVLVSLVRQQLSNHANAESVTFSCSSCKKPCCDVSSEGWEGKDRVMLYSLCGLAELIKHSERIRNDLEICSGRMRYSVTELIESLQDVCVTKSGDGIRWFASYALSSLGIFGFPSALGKRFGKAVREAGHEDTRLILENGQHLNSHGVFLAMRCPTLLRLEEAHLGDRNCHSSVSSSTETSRELQREVRLSGQVNHQGMLKILDFVYLGYLQAGEVDTKMLKALAKSYDLQPLLQMLCRERPKWGTPFPDFDLSLALGSLGYHVSDVILETNELQNWECDFCTYSVPHLHVHKVVLASKCRYMWGLFYSGMQESFSQSIKLNLSWEAMDKLVAWFYTDELLSPASRCLWEYMSDEEKLQALKPYLELCWVFDYWVLEDIKKACLRMVVSHLEPAPQLSIKIIKIAVPPETWELVKGLSHFWTQELVEAATTLAAPLYHQFRDSGELEDLDKDIVHMIFAASVQDALGNLLLRSQMEI